MLIRSLSVVIPAYNEQARIKRTLTKIHHYLARRCSDPPSRAPGLPGEAVRFPGGDVAPRRGACDGATSLSVGLHYEILVVDDGSTDQTRAIIERCELPHVRTVAMRRNQGKGSAVRKGVLQARYDWVLFCDADGSTPIRELDALLHHADADVIIGSRGLPRSRILIRQPWYRELSGRLFNWCVRVLVLQGIGDTQCGFKLFRREVARRVFPKQTIRGFGFDVEVLYLARKYGYRISEVPVVWLNDKHTRVRLLRDAVRMFGDLLRIRLNEARGRYGVSAKGAGRMPVGRRVLHQAARV